MGSCGGEGSTITAINNSGHCKIHPSIQIKRRKRNGEWLQLMKECPLCLADDDDSVWSSSCGSSVASPRASRLSPSSNRRQQLRRHLTPVPPPPPPPPSHASPWSPSKFKEHKDDEVSASSTCLADDEMVSQGSSDHSIASYDMRSLRRKELRDKLSSHKLPPLPLTAHEAKVDITQVAHSHVPVGTNCATTLEQLVQHRKDEIRKLKIRTLVPPSQRYHNFNVDEINQRDDKTTGNSFHLEDLQYLSECESSSQSKEVQDKFENLSSSFHSEASHHMGTLTKDVLFHASGKPGRSFHSESTKRTGNRTNDRPLKADGRPPKSSFHSASTWHVGNLKDQKHLNRSTMEISYDSFVEQTQMRRRDSDEDTLVQDNTSSSRGYNNDQNMESIPESEMDSSVFDSAINFDKATNDIWGSSSTRSSSSKSSSSSGSCDYHLGGSGYEDHMRERGATAQNLHNGSRFVSGGNESASRRRQQDAKAQTAVGSHDTFSFDDLNKELQSMQLDSNKREHSRNHKREEIIVEGVSEEESSCSDGQDADCFSVGSLHGKESLGDTPFASLQKSNHHSNTQPDPPSSDTPDADISPGSDSTSSCSSYDTLAQEGLDDYWMAFNDINSSSPHHGREKKRLKMLSGRRGTSQSNPRTKGNSSSPFLSEESRSPQCIEGGRGAAKHGGMRESESPSNPLPSIHTSHSSSSSEESRESCFEKKSRSQGCSGKKKSDEHSSSSKRSPNILPEKRPSTSVDRSSISSQSEAKRRSSPHVSNVQSSPREESVFMRQDSDSSEESQRTFSKCDSQGRCLRHPHVQLRRKRRLGGWTKGKWKTILTNCTECCYEEVQRLRMKNLRAREQLQKVVGQPSTSCIDTSDRYNTSATESLSSDSSTYTSSDGISSDDTSSNSTSTYGIPPSQQPAGILRKPRHQLDESSYSSNSTESELTTTFSYLSSLSGNSTSTGLSTASSSFSTGSSTAVRSYPSQSSRPRVGILRRSSVASSRNGHSRRSSHSGSTKDSRRSQGSRVVFAGRDYIINPVRFAS